MNFFLILFLVCLFTLILVLACQKKDLEKKFQKYLQSRDAEISRHFQKLRDEEQEKYEVAREKYNSEINSLNELVIEKQEEIHNKYKEYEEKEIQNLSKKQKEFQDQMSSLKEIYDSQMKDLGSNIDKDLEQIKKEKIANIENEALKRKHELEIQFIEEKKKLDEQMATVFGQTQDDIKLILEEKQIILEELEDFRKKREAILEATARERQLNEQQDFFRLQLSEDDLEDIELLRAMQLKLRHREIIPKVIWETLISRPTSEMIKRVTGAKEVSGIYKITYIKTGESYIGKTTNIRTRWKSHIQTALGMEKAASSTLHIHMSQHPLNDYTFEILEEVEKDQLGEREKYYIELYGTIKQLNMKAGG